MAERYLKQVIVVRKDLSMPTGKIAAMTAHASITFLLKKLKLGDLNQVSEPPRMSVEGLTPEEYQWLTELEPGLEHLNQLSMAKIVLQVNSLEELLEVERKAIEAGVTVHRVTDGGHSHNKPGDIPCIALGPDWPEKLTPATGNLKVYR